TYYIVMTMFSYVVLLFNTVAYLGLSFLPLLRLMFFFPRLRSDVMRHEKGPGFFTLVAGTGVLGRQIYILTGLTYLSLALCILGILLWVVVMYTFLTSVTIRKTKPRLSKGINGAWLIAAVGTQSVSILGTLLSPEM